MYRVRIPCPTGNDSVWTPAFDTVQELLTHGNLTLGPCGMKVYDRGGFVGYLWKD